VRIANILTQRAAEDSARSTPTNLNSKGIDNGTGRQPKKQKVVIHTSPFLRCLQTSVGIGAGMAQSLQLPEQRRPRSTAGKSTVGEAEASQDTDEYSVKALGLSTPDQVNIKTTLRVDAFLGEWLSPDYFDKITPPPSSTMMVASAKAHLLKKEQIEVFQSSSYRAGNFPGGWSRATLSGEMPNSSSTAVVEDYISFDRMSLMAPLRQQRSNSANNSGDRSGNIKPMLSSLRPSKAAYDPPIPAYAIKPSDPIPRGYCVHARDACTDMDLLWDSNRFPQDWGDGGSLGEEWSAMHKRFRRGLSKMIDWYKSHTPEFHPDREDALALDQEIPEEDDEDYNLTVVLVTHAAGCNALVGALTNQPVLHDFALTSLSMAVRKEPDPEMHGKNPLPVNSHNISPFDSRRSFVYMGLSDEYDMQILSSTNHLRAGARAASASALMSPHLVPKIPTYASLSHTSNGTEQEPKRGAMSTALGSIRRPSVTPAMPLSYDYPTSPSTISPSISTGLWSRTSTLSSSTDEMPSLFIGAPAHTGEVTTNTKQPSRPVSPKYSEHGAKKEEDDVAPLPTALASKTMSQRAAGLWTVLASDRRVWGPRPKRRWTVTEHDEFE
jgi:hypothetical protein